MNKFSFPAVVCLLFTVFCFLPEPAFATKASLSLHPTRIVLNKNERSVTLGVRNNGDGAGAYRVEVVDMHMGEERIEEVKEGEKEPFSAKDFIRISPRSMTIEPDQDQNIRIIIRRPAGLEDGEYRAHIKVTMLEDNVELEKEGSIQKTQTNVLVDSKQRLSITIPLIIRYGKPEYKISIADAKIRYSLSPKGKKTPYADFILIRQGNRSSMGDFDIEYINTKGTRSLLRHYVGVPVYRPTERRKVSIPLEVPEGVTLGKGTLRITYKAQEKEGSTVLATEDFVL